jgi:hypothetical protein
LTTVAQTRQFTISIFISAVDPNPGLRLQEGYYLCKCQWVGATGSGAVRYAAVLFAWHYAACQESAEPIRPQNL